MVGHEAQGRLHRLVRSIRGKFLLLAILVPLLLQACGDSTLNNPLANSTPTPSSTPITSPTPSPASSFQVDVGTIIYDIVYWCFVWVIIPLIILSMLLFSIIIAFRIVDTEQKVSARAGLLAGLVLFVIYGVSQLRSIQAPHFSTLSPQLDLASWIAIGFGLTVGFLLLWIVRRLIPTRLVGLLTLILSAASLAALFSYLFASDIRDLTLFFALSAVLGILVHVMFFPKTLREIFA